MAESSLAWVRLDGAESCVAATELAVAIEQRLGRAVFVAPADAEIAVEGRVERAEGAWRAVVRLTDATGAILGDRTVESRAESCDELGRVAATVIALMVDPLTAPEPPPPVELPPEVPPTATWKLEVDGSLIAGLGIAPGIAVGGYSALIVTPPAFVAFVVDGALVPFARASVGEDHAILTRMVGGAQLCPLAVGDGDLLGCLGGDVGVMFASNSNQPVGATERVLADAHGSIRYRGDLVHGFVWAVGLHGVVPFRRAAFESGEGQLYRAPAYGGFVDLGLGVVF